MPSKDRAPKRHHFFSTAWKPQAPASSVLDLVFANVAEASRLARKRLEETPDCPHAPAVLRFAADLETLRDYLAANAPALLAVQAAQALEMHLGELVAGPHVAAALKLHEGRKNKRDFAAAQRIALQCKAYKVARKTKGSAEAVLEAFKRECTRRGVPVSEKMTTDALRRRRLDWKKRGL